MVSDLGNRELVKYIIKHTYHTLVNYNIDN